MPIGRRTLLALLLTSLCGCARGPDRDEALSAIRAAQPGVDSATATGRVWQDGPPWFSCAEVIAKFATPIDSAAVRDQVGNWKPLVVMGWIVLRDTASDSVSDPGWCTASVTPAGAANVARWSTAPGAVFPTGQLRRGWTMVVGRRRILVRSAPALTGKDSARAEYVVTVAPNADGAATGADRDTARFVADLRRVDGQWKVAGTRPQGRD